MRPILFSTRSDRVNQFKEAHKNRKTRVEGSKLFFVYQTMNCTLSRLEEKIFPCNYHLIRAENFTAMLLYANSK
ncbi:hypothetical protein PtA15_11A152 [Puccinia triticina]|uniref:Uncharacterized protein n=1 Tax=Puccinia triticina TaxID=208348 RepID=A0ABY7CW12_9BASI|nr:uncharacterized protein PtA15_11A152 [Puccinia triticina]WAQ89464.1 hypothetical protein PtA15_11A152 [Puccinia triticina]